MAPRPLYVLATQQAGREAALTYTLRTRVARGDMEDELTKVGACWACVLWEERGGSAVAAMEWTGRHGCAVGHVCMRVCKLGWAG